MESPDGCVPRQRRQQRAATIVISNDFFSTIDTKIDAFNLAQIQGSETSDKVSEYVNHCLKELLGKQIILMEKIHDDRLNLELKSYEQVKDLLSNQTAAVKDKAKETHESNVQMISSISKNFKDQVTSKIETFYSIITENVRNFIRQSLDSHYASARFSLNEYKKRIREELFVSRSAVDLYRQAYDDSARHLHLEKMRLLIDEFDDKKQRTLDEMKRNVDNAELKALVWEKRVRDLEGERDQFKSQVEIEKKKSEKLVKKIQQNVIASDYRNNIHEKRSSSTEKIDSMNDDDAGESKANIEYIKYELNAIIGEKNNIIEDKDKEIEHLKNELSEAKVAFEINNEEQAKVVIVEKNHLSRPESLLPDVDAVQENKSVEYADAETMTEYELNHPLSESIVSVKIVDVPVSSAEIIESIVDAPITEETESTRLSREVDIIKDDSKIELNRHKLKVNIRVDVTVQNIDDIIDNKIINGDDDTISICDASNVKENVPLWSLEVEEDVIKVTKIMEPTTDFSTEILSLSNQELKEELVTYVPEPKTDESTKKVNEEPDKFISVLDMESIVSQGNVLGSSTISLELDSQYSLQEPSDNKPSSSCKMFPIVFTSSQVKVLLDKRQDSEKELKTKILSLEYQNSKLSNRIRSDESYFEKQDMIYKLRLRERGLLLKALIEKVKVLTEKLDKDKFFRQQKISNSGLPIINMTQRPQTGFSKQAMEIFPAEISFSPPSIADLNLNRSESAPQVRIQHVDVKKNRPSTSTAVNILKRIDIAGDADGPRLPITDDKLNALYNDDFFNELPLQIEDVNEIKDIRKQIMDVLSSQKPHIPRNIQLATSLAAKTKMKGRNLHPKPFLASKSTKGRNTSPQPRDVVVSPPEKLYKRRQEERPGY